MKLLLRKIERDYSNSLGMFSSSHIQDVSVYDMDKKHLGSVVLVQGSTHSNRWGRYFIPGYIHKNTLNKTLIEEITKKYGEFNIDVANKIFNPTKFTKPDEFEEMWAEGEKEE